MKTIIGIEIPIVDLHVATNHGVYISYPRVVCFVCWQWGSVLIHLPLYCKAGGGC
jgi:hypothetical protein